MFAIDSVTGYIGGDDIMGNPIVTQGTIFAARACLDRGDLNGAARVGGEIQRKIAATKAAEQLARHLNEVAGEVPEAIAGATPQQKAATIRSYVQV